MAFSLEGFWANHASGESTACGTSYRGYLLVTSRGSCEALAAQADGNCTRLTNPTAVLLLSESKTRALPDVRALFYPHLQVRKKLFPLRL